MVDAKDKHSFFEEKPTSPRTATLEAQDGDRSSDDRDLSKSERQELKSMDLEDRSCRQNLSFWVIREE
ncbi:Hypothetical predicted protein, partial [Pelobates cultripes]